MAAWPTACTRLPPERWRSGRRRSRAAPASTWSCSRRGDRGARHAAKAGARRECLHGSLRGDTWALKRLDASHVLALKSRESAAQRRPLEWALTMLFYALIALVLMIWIWPLTRDLRDAGEGRGAVRQPQLGVRRADQAALADLSSGGDLPPDGGAHRRPDRLPQGHVERGLARDQDAAVAHAV